MQLPVQRQMRIAQMDILSAAMVNIRRIRVYGGPLLGCAGVLKF